MYICRTYFKIHCFKLVYCFYRRKKTFNIFVKGFLFLQKKKLYCKEKTVYLLSKNNSINLKSVYNG